MSYFTPPQHSFARSNFEAGIYRDSTSGRQRWAVLDRATSVWYFPDRYGFRAAVSMARRMNKEAL